MNRTVTLAKRENEIAECVAWGGSYKETASLLKISIRTVDNTLRKIKEKLGLNKINEISAWWFCTHHDISFDLSPFVKKQISVALLCVFIGGEIAIFNDSSYTTRRSRRTRTEFRVKRQETSINQPYII
jgi:DNA-binding CsgD family transcriptional regulator